MAAALVVAPVVCAGRLEAASRGLTINIGLRWSYESPFETKYGQQSQFDPDGEGPGQRPHWAPSCTQPGRLAKKDLNNFAPRLGLAWNFHPKWVFRGSFGVVHQDIFATGTNIMYQEYLATATLQAPGGRSAARLPPVARAAAFSISLAAGRLCAVHRHQLLQPRRPAGGIRTCACRT